MYNSFYGFIRPVFDPSFPKIDVSYHDSKLVPMIRAADITANWIYCANRDYEKYPYAFNKLWNNVVIFNHP